LLAVIERFTTASPSDGRQRQMLVNMRATTTNEWTKAEHALAYRALKEIPHRQEGKDLAGRSAHHFGDFDGCGNPFPHCWHTVLR
jgi:hypothetical protein